MSISQNIENKLCDCVLKVSNAKTKIGAIVAGVVVGVSTSAQAFASETKVNLFSSISESDAQAVLTNITTDLAPKLAGTLFLFIAFRKGWSWFFGSLRKA